MNVGGEIIKLSFGPASNAITSHLTNLEGLACTSSSQDDKQQDPICDPYITHTIQKDQYVPRVLFVDTQNCFHPWPDLKNNTSNSNHSQPSTWNGNVEIHNRQESQDILSYKSTNNSMQNLHSNQVHAFDVFQQTANIMSHTSDRYQSSKYQHVSSQFVYSETIATDDGRTMKWDDEEEEELDEYTRERMKMAQLERQRKQEYELSTQMYSAWDTFLGTQHDSSTEEIQNKIPSKNEKEESTKISSPAEMRNHALRSLQWMQYFMPPHPFAQMYSAPLSFDRNLSRNYNRNKAIDEALLYSFHMGKHASSSNFCSVNDLSMGITREWREDVLGDSIRKWMEDCDSIRGFQVLVDSDECLFGGLASSVLEELNDECKSAAKFSIVVQDGDAFVSNSDQAQDEQEKGKSKHWRSENKVVAQFRNELNGGLLMHGITENSSLVLPLSVSKAWDALHKEKQYRNLFEASAAAAISLENITLPFRLAHQSASKKSKIGVGNGYFQGTTQVEDDMFPSAEKLSIHELISSMKPSNRHIMTELSCLSRPLSPMQIHNALLQGTSIERRQLEEERNRNRSSYYKRTRGRDADPGTWMEDEGGNCGILSSLSPVGVDAATTCRSMHQHFALSSSFRPLPSRVGDVISTYTTCMMEGMAIGYRPQSTIATVVGQSFNELVGGKSNIAGSYWKHILGEQAPILQTLSTLGNSTRVYDHLKQTSNGLKSALSRKYSGYLSRDGMTGLAPESEDCDEAMEACLTLRDVYEPSSMGFDSDEEGYFEDNSD